MKIRSLICDDEDSNRKNLRNLLTEYCPNIEIIGESSTNEETLQKILKENPDLVFLDIRMHKKTVFEVLSQIDNPRFEIIFVTAYDEYAFKAIKFNALDYLLKPIDINELQKSVQKVKDKIFEQNENSRLLKLISNLRLEDIEKKIALPQENEIVFVPIKEIIRCQAESNYTRFYFTSGKSLIISRTLKEFDQALSGYNFVRIHQSHLINTKLISSYVKQDGGYLKMIDGSSVSIARSRKDELSHILHNF